MMKFNINRVKLQEGVLTYSLDLSSELAKQLIAKYPELIKVVGSDTPSYFKCNKNDEDFGFTMGRIYKEDVTIPRITNCINLNSDRNKPVSIYGHANSDTPSGFTSGFELSTKKEYDKQELLDKAKRDYPVGTVFKTKYGMHRVVENKPFVCPREHSVIQIQTNRFLHGANIYTIEDGWAEIVPLKFTTEDGVSIYGDMRTYMVYSDLTMSNVSMNNEGTNGMIKYFYHKENALAYIEKHKEKTLKDYENMLLRTNINSINAREVCWFYNTLKGKEPKLYYTKILQLIADDLNNGWVADFNDGNQIKHHLQEDGDTALAYAINRQGVVYFKTLELAEKARAILGDNVKFLFS